MQLMRPARDLRTPGHHSSWAPGAGHGQRELLAYKHVVRRARAHYRCGIANNPARNARLFRAAFIIRAEHNQRSGNIRNENRRAANERQQKNPFARTCVKRVNNAAPDCADYRRCPAVNRRLIIREPNETPKKRGRHARGRILSAERRSFLQYKKTRAYIYVTHRSWKRAAGPFPGKCTLIRSVGGRRVAGRRFHRRLSCGRVNICRGAHLSKHSASAARSNYFPFGQK